MVQCHETFGGYPTRAAAPIFACDLEYEVATPRISKEALAEMVGTTCSRVSFLMNRFRKLSWIIALAMNCR
jgi:CRP-like cAMP-binding protein